MDWKREAPREGPEPSGRSRLAPLLLPLLLAACTSLLEPSQRSEPWGPTDITVEGMVLARACGDSRGLPLRRQPSSLRLRIVHQDVILIRGAEVHGYGADVTIWLVAWLKEEPAMWGHEALHLLYDLPGGFGTPHPPIFRACGL